MPKKLLAESQAEQSARFVATAERMIAAGELDPVAASLRVERFLATSARKVPEAKPVATSGPKTGAKDR
jgi:hypothetical protein